PVGGHICCQIIQQSRRLFIGQIFGQGRALHVEAHVRDISRPTRTIQSSIGDLLYAVTSTTFRQNDLLAGSVRQVRKRTRTTGGFPPLFAGLPARPCSSQRRRAL